MRSLKDYKKKIDLLFDINPYSIKKKNKYNDLLHYFNFLISYHYKKNLNYKKIIQRMYKNKKKYLKLQDMPFLTSALFKDIDLLSISKKKVVKELNSSGTTGNILTRIYLDKFNSSNQVKALKIIIQNILGTSRLPMLIIDQDPRSIKNFKINARLAAINGFSIFGKNHTYALDEKFNLDYKKVNEFLKKYHNKIFFVFGFTSFIYMNLIKNLDKSKIKYDFRNSVLIHGGGWKKLERIKITNKKFNTLLKNKIKIKKIANYYGLVEQTGSIFVECEKGYFHCSNFSDIIIRDKDLKVLPIGSRGLVQLFSILPTSYPGHILLTEDEGQIISDGLCKICGKYGKKFKIFGRTQMAETRGCSDTR